MEPVAINYSKLSTLTREEILAEAIDQFVQRGLLKVEDVDELVKHGVPQDAIDLYKNKNGYEEKNIFKRGIKWILNGFLRR